MSLALKVARASSQGGIPVGVGVRSGDPGIFDFIKRAGRAAIGVFAPPGLLQAASFVRTQFRGGGGPGPQIRSIPLGPSGALPPQGPSAPQVSNGANGLLIPTGFHLNKSDYFLRDGTFVPAGTRIVKNRRRNALNPKALRKAVSRIDAGKIWQGKLAEISTKTFTAAGKRKSEEHHHHRRRSAKK